MNELVNVKLKSIPRNRLFGSVGHRSSIYTELVRYVSRSATRFILLFSHGFCPRVMLFSAFRSKVPRRRHFRPIFKTRGSLFHTILIASDLFLIMSLLFIHCNLNNMAIIGRYQDFIYRNIGSNVCSNSRGDSPTCWSIIIRIIYCYYTFPIMRIIRSFFKFHFFSISFSAICNYL